MNYFTLISFAFILYCVGGKGLLSNNLGISDAKASQASKPTIKDAKEMPVKFRNLLSLNNQQQFRGFHPFQALPGNHHMGLSNDKPEQIKRAPTPDEDDDPITPPDDHDTESPDHASTEPPNHHQTKPPDHDSTPPPDKRTPPSSPEIFPLPPIPVIFPLPPLPHHFPGIPAIPYYPVPHYYRPLIYHHTYFWLPSCQSIYWKCPKEFLPYAPYHYVHDQPYNYDHDPNQWWHRYYNRKRRSLSELQN